jgi:uncharacterized integral membrane protein
MKKSYYKTLIKKFSIAMLVNSILVALVPYLIITAFGVNVDDNVGLNYLGWILPPIILVLISLVAIYSALIYLGYEKKNMFFYYLTYVFSMFTLFGAYLPSTIYLYILLNRYEQK